MREDDEKVVKSIFGLFKVLLPFIEISFLAFILGNLLDSSATAVVIFLFLFVFSFFVSFIIPLAWGVTMFLFISTISNILFGIIAGLVFGGGRFLIKKI
ncbi:hypothetical protein [Thermoflavimicrobium dichotomicum]|uniref:Uncharacterized protein n=1 Tax=Thermoflavimicrobium dichotomicum TaxID=46223 RepID=A0A1I3LVD2_9BACL|nr:hypothetical protein [Thermoflavimicrobium dichotomicum]SFI88721.1 hypothetical protein SAMN05421852_102337 [Thermoflavimicrobium dichotomicum]